jgi:hypothetical protein
VQEKNRGLAIVPREHYGVLSALGNVFASRGKGLSFPIALRKEEKMKAFKQLFAEQTLPGTVPQGYDPELLFVECKKCGAPVLWAQGQASQILASAGVDPLELDASCVLMSDGCPACSAQPQYTVQIYRIEGAGHLSAAKKSGSA